MRNRSHFIGPLTTVNRYMNFSREENFTMVSDQVFFFFRIACTESEQIILISVFCGS